MGSCIASKPKKKGWHKLAEEQQPPTYNHSEFDDLVEVFMCEVKLGSLQREKLIELLASESFLHHNVVICINKENSKKARLCRWPCSRKDVKAIKVFFK